MYSLEGRPMPPPLEKAHPLWVTLYMTYKMNAESQKENTFMFMLSLHLTLR